MKWVVSTVFTLAAAYLLLLCFPYKLFGYKSSFDNITVYSDRPIPAAINPILNSARERLRRSPLDDPRLNHRVFICNDNRLFTLFANYRNRTGGLNYALLNRNVFLRAANIEDNRLIGPSGKEVPGERTLSYFTAHEIAHSLEVSYLGRFAYWQLPEWKREGYADVVARDGDFHFGEQLAAFRRSDPTMDPKASGLYLRYQLQATYLLDRQGVTPAKFFTQAFDLNSLDRELREKN